MAYAGGLEQAIYDRMANDTELQNLLGTLSGGSPAIYTARPVPEDTPEPYVLAIGFRNVSSNTQASTKSSRSRRYRKLVRVYAEQDKGLIRDIEDAAERIYDLFDDRPFDDSDLDGNHCNVIANASGPRMAPDEQDMQGRIVRLTHLMQEIN